MSNYAGMKHAKDWEGKRVRLLKDCDTTYFKAPKGTTGTVMQCVRNGSIVIEVDQYKHLVRNLSYGDFELVNDDQYTDHLPFKLCQNCFFYFKLKYFNCPYCNSTFLEIV